MKKIVSSDTFTRPSAVKHCKKQGKKAEVKAASKFDVANKASSFFLKEYAG